MLQVQQGDFQITNESEFKVLTEQTSQLLQQFEALKTDMRDLDENWRELENKTGDEQQNLQFQLGKETKERENDIQNVNTSKFHNY